MSKLWGEIVEKLNPYTPGEQPNDLNLMKLNTNENPYGPSPYVLKNIKNKCNDSLRLYPDPESIELKKSLFRFNLLLIPFFELIYIYYKNIWIIY